MSLYFYLLLGSISIPLILSFEKSLSFYKKWRYLFPAIIIVSIIFIIWDIFFTINGIWGFNDRYITGLKIFSLPIEEILFFILIPYASIFGFCSIKLHFPGYRVNYTFTLILTIILLFISGLGSFYFHSKIYTLVNFTFFAFVLIFAYMFFRDLLKYLYAIFPIIFIPFLVVNGILTGTRIENEVVWYNEKHIMGLRIHTIPIEDAFYAFSLILSVLMIMELFIKIKKKNIAVHE